MNKVFIFGHKNPDSDTICSALAYAELKKAMGTEAVAVKLGEINNETKFILKYFYVPEPETLNTIKTQVRDLEIDDAVCVSPTISVRAAWELMKQNTKKTLVVVDGEKKLVGLASLSDITRNYMDVGENTLLAVSRTSYANIIETLQARILLGSPETHIATGRVVIAAQRHTHLNNYVEQGDVVISDISESIREAILNGAQLIICTCGVYPDAEDVEIAGENNCDIISTGFDTFTTAMLIRQSIPIEHVMTTRNISTVSLDDFKEDAREKMLKSRYRNYPVVDGDGKVAGMISRYHLLSKNRKKAILVDHNERSQTANGIEEAEILEIIDHHRLGDIQTSNPILMKNEPVGSTSTIIATLYEAHQVAIPPQIAGILLSAIISDTLNFQSPTCTKQDTEIAKRLEIIADVNIAELALKIINAGSTLRGKTTDEIINSDLKEYKIGKYRIGIAQVYSIDFESLSDMYSAILERMLYFCDKKGFSLLVLLVTDLNRGGSEALLAGERKDIFFKAYKLEPTHESVFLPKVLSRKKQVVPLIMSFEDEL